MIERSEKTASFVGVISDTHGLLRPEAIAALEGAELILHAGDIHTPEVLTALREIAPVVAVRGNHDRSKWANELKEIETIIIGNVLICMIHDLNALKIEAAESNFKVVIFGHSHKPLLEKREDVLYLNPGSAGPRRFTLPVTIARLRTDGPEVRAEIIEIIKTKTDELVVK